MDTINYNHVKLPGRDSIVRVEVKLAGKKVGEIKPVDGGFQYFPNRAEGGEVFPTLGLCKRSLETDESPTTFASDVTNTDGYNFGGFVR
jgi:hypothetical protein